MHALRRESREGTWTFYRSNIEIRRIAILSHQIYTSSIDCKTEGRRPTMHFLCFFLSSFLRILPSLNLLFPIY